MAEQKKYLQQRFTDQGFARIFDHTDFLAQRPDMYPYFGEVPASRIVRIGSAEHAPKAAQPMMHFDSKKIVEGPGTDAPATVVDAVTIPETTATATATIAEIDTERIASPDDEIPSPVPATPQLEGQAKIDKLCEVIKAFPKDEEHYTTNGLPKIDALVMALGQDVRSDERKAAMAKLGMVPTK